VSNRSRRNLVQDYNTDMLNDDELEAYYQLEILKIRRRRDAALLVSPYR
jgi:hypothetical protein